MAQKRHGSSIGNPEKIPWGEASIKFGVGKKRCASLPPPRSPNKNWKTKKFLNWILQILIQKKSCFFFNFLGALEEDRCWGVSDLFGRWRRMENSNGGRRRFNFLTRKNTFSVYDPHKIFNFCQTIVMELGENNIKHNLANSKHFNSSGAWQCRLLHHSPSTNKSQKGAQRRSLLSPECS